MSKLPRHLENPIDDILVEISDALAPTLKATGHTPNVLTTYSVACGALALRALWVDNFWAFAVLWIARTFWDDADGHFARKYGMVTRMGDAYDHLNDTLSQVALLVVVYSKYNVPAWVWVVYVGLLLTSMVQLGSQQQYIAARGKNTGESLDVLGYIGSEAWLPWVRFLGHGTFQMTIVALVWYLCRHHQT